MTRRFESDFIIGYILNLTSGRSLPEVFCWWEFDAKKFINKFLKMSSPLLPFNGTHLIWHVKTALYPQMKLMMTRTIISHVNFRQRNVFQEYTVKVYWYRSSMCLVSLKSDAMHKRYHIYIYSHHNSLSI